MSSELAVLHAIPAWRVLALALRGVIKWQYGQVQGARNDAEDRAVPVAGCVQARESLAGLARKQGKALEGLTLAANRLQQ